MTTSRIRVLVADDHHVLRAGLRRAIGLEPDFQIVAEARSGIEAVNAFAAHKPELVLMDVRMGEFDGIAATAAICSREPGAQVLAFSSYDTVELLEQLIRAGARGFVPKGADIAELLRAMRLVAAGGTYVPAELARRFDDATRRPLTFREREILSLFAHGCTAKEVAHQLALTEGTVHVYSHRILRKLGVRNRAEAIASALRSGVLRTGLAA